MDPFLRTLEVPGEQGQNGIVDGKIVRLIPSSMVDTPVMDYQKWLNESNERLADLSNVSADTKIAIIGAGMSGLLTGFELLRSGFTNFKIYESTNRIGGRFYSYEFPNDNSNFAELGAMRFPPSENCLYWYIKYMQDNPGRTTGEIRLSPDFPDPGLVPSLVLYNGEQYTIEPGQPIPEIFRDIHDSWNGFLNTKEPVILPNGIKLDPPAAIMEWLNIDDPATYNPVKAQNAWQGYVNYFKDKSFIEGIIDIFCQPFAPHTYDSQLDKWGARYQWSYPQDIEKFGTIGTGIGGQSPLFTIGFVCMMRFTLNKLEENHALILTGTDSVADALADFDFNGKKLRDFIELNSPVKSINPEGQGETVSLAGNSGSIITSGVNHLVIAVTQRAAEIELGLDSLWQAKNKTVANNLISLRKRQAVTNVHIAQSSKFFLKVKPWWLGDANKDKIRCITTDTAMANFYTLDYNPDDTEAVCLLNYVWEDFSEKAEALGELDERYQRFLHDLRQIEGIDYILEAMPDHVTDDNAVMIDWQLQKYYNGAFALTQATQEDFLSQLYYNFMNLSGTAAKIYFAGDSYSWVGGWVEGALQTGLNAFAAIVESVNGTFTSPENTPLQKMNAKSIVYDNPSSTGTVMSFGPYGGASVKTNYFKQSVATGATMTVHIRGNSICGIEVNGSLSGKPGYETQPVNLQEPIHTLEIYVTNSEYYRATIVRCFKINDTLYGGIPEEGDLHYAIPFDNPSRITSVMGLTGDAVDRLGFSFEAIDNSQQLKKMKKMALNLKSSSAALMLLMCMMLGMTSCKKKKKAPEENTTTTTNTEAVITPQELSVNNVSDFNFPEDSTAIYQWLSARDTASIGRHAWGLWANLTEKTGVMYQGDSLRRFETWLGVKAVAALCKPILVKGQQQEQVKHGRTPLSVPRQFIHAQEFARQAVIDSSFQLFETVSYNPAAAGYAIQNKIFNVSVLNKYKVQNGIGRIPPFPANAITTKPTYYAGVPDENGLIRVPAWPGTPNPAKAFKDTIWHTYVYADIHNNQPANKKLVPAKGENPTQAQIAAATCNVNDFINYKLDAAAAAYLNKTENIDDRKFKAGDLILLVAMHVATKEISNWTWQTYFWSYQPDTPSSPSSAFYAGLRPAELKGAARHYAVSPAYAMVWPNQPINGGTNKGVTPIIAFNPYLEAGFGPGTFTGMPNTLNPNFKYGVQTNCMSCHALAIASDNGKYSTDQYISMDDPSLFGNEVQVDFAWSIQGNENKND